MLHEPDVWSTLFERPNATLEYKVSSNHSLLHSFTLSKDALPIPVLQYKTAYIFVGKAKAIFDTTQNKYAPEIDVQFQVFSVHSSHLQAKTFQELGGRELGLPKDC